MIEYNNISFRKLENKKTDYIKIYNWCQNKHVYEYFEQRKLNYEEIETKYKEKLKQKTQKLYIIKSDNKDIGLVQIYKYEKNIDLKELDKYKNVYEYDLFIGDKTYINKGLGTIIIGEINNLIYRKYNCDCIILRPFKKNIRAIKCYEKSKFNKIYEYNDKDTLGNPEVILVYIMETNKCK